jgi:hypothetical protein
VCCCPELPYATSLSPVDNPSDKDAMLSGESNLVAGQRATAPIPANEACSNLLSAPAGPTGPHSQCRRQKLPESLLTPPPWVSHRAVLQASDCVTSRMSHKNGGGKYSTPPIGLRHHLLFALRGPQDIDCHAPQDVGGKNTSARTSMLSRGGAPDANGFSKEVWNDSRARPSFELSWIRINKASSVCCSEK